MVRRIAAGAVERPPLTRRSSPMGCSFAADDQTIVWSADLVPA